MYELAEGVTLDGVELCEPRLLTAMNSDFDTSKSWLAVAWYPILCHAHTASNIRGSFITYHRFRYAPAWDSVFDKHYPTPHKKGAEGQPQKGAQTPQQAGKEPQQAEPQTEQQAETQQTEQQSELQQAEPQQTEPPQAETQQTEPQKAETQQAELQQTEVQQTAPQQTEPQQTEPERAETQQAESQQTEQQADVKSDDDAAHQKEEACDQVPKGVLPLLPAQGGDDDDATLVREPEAQEASAQPQPQCEEEIPCEASQEEETPREDSQQLEIPREDIQQADTQLEDGMSAPSPVHASVTSDCKTNTSVKVGDEPLQRAVLTDSIIEYSTYKCLKNILFTAVLQCPIHDIIP
jgi:hypothetical protein